jgi:hypothetical protein
MCDSKAGEGGHGFERNPARDPDRWRYPCWEGYRGLLGRLDLTTFPELPQLNGLLPPGAVSGGGAPLQFVPARQLSGAEYERRIFEKGEVSTRGNDWHDLFNALVWCRWPRTKAALNAVHHRNLHLQRGGRRGPRRDALTLLDESGALVVSRNADLLQALARRDWREAFVAMRGVWAHDTRVVICGHALLEKLLDPWKSITAHALLLQVESPRSPPPDGAEFPACLDTVLGERLEAGGLCDSPADLSPLPLAGIPGWWLNGPQDTEFYADKAVFRAPPEGVRPAPVHRLRFSDRVLY